MSETPEFIRAHAVLAPARPLPRHSEALESFVAAASHEFPTVAARHLLPPDVGPQPPHLLLQSTSSQLAVSSLQVDFEVRFYGSYLNDRTTCLEYVRRKVEAIVSALNAIGATPSIFGLVLELNYRSPAGELSPASRLLASHVNAAVASELVQDVNLRLGLRLEDVYFLNVTVANYEQRVLERPAMPGQHFVTVKPWEGSVHETGIQVQIDINNRLEALVNKTDPEVGTAEIERALEILAEASGAVADGYVASGMLDVSSLASKIRTR